MPTVVSEKPISAKEAGKMLGVTARTVIRLAEKGDIPGFRVGDLWKFYASDIQDFIDKQRKPRDKAKQEDTD